MGYNRAATGFQVINIPCLYKGHRHPLGTPGLQRILAGVHHLSSSVYSRSLVIPCLYHQKPIHSSDHGVGNTSSAGILQRSDSEAVCGIGAWASTIHAAGEVLASEFPPWVSSSGCPISWEGVPHRSMQQVQEGQRQSRAACLGERRRAMGKSILAYSLQLPLLLL